MASPDYLTESNAKTARLIPGLRVTLIAVGTRGDVHPTLVLGQRLKRYGLDVRVFSHPEFQDSVEKFGLTYLPFSLSFEKAMNSELGARWLETGQDFEAYTREIANFLRSYFSPRIEEMVAACRDSELLLFTYLGVATVHIGEKLNIPCMATWPTGAALYPSTSLPQVENACKAPFGPLRNALAHYLCEIPIHRHLGGVQNEWRKSLGLLPIGFPGIYAYFRRTKLPILYGFSKHLAPPPSFWPAHHKVTGYWIPESDVPLDSWDPQLATFIESGSPPIFVGFGSMRLRDPQKAISQVVQAVKQLNIRAVFAAGKIGVTAQAIQPTLPPEVFAVDTVSHAWLFPKMRTVVHHGGANTTGAACLAGIPSIAICFCADAALWAQRLADLGIGGPPIYREDFNANTLASALQVALEPEVAARAKALSAKIAAERGAEEAVGEILRYASRLREQKKASGAMPS